MLILFSPRPSVLSISALILEFYFIKSRYDSNDECLILVYIQHSQPHITFYPDDIFLNWGVNNECNVEPLIVIVFSASSYYLSTTYTGH